MPTSSQGRERRIKDYTITPYEELGGDRPIQGFRISPGLGLGIAIALNELIERNPSLPVDHMINLDGLGRNLADDGTTYTDFRYVNRAYTGHADERDELAAEAKTLLESTGAQVVMIESDPI